MKSLKNCDFDGSHESYIAKGPFIKDVINGGGGGLAKRWSYLISLFSKSDDEGGWGVKNL